jgi:hypothetical protein
VKRKSQWDIVVFVTLVAIGVAGRWIGAHGLVNDLPPNATPLAAIGLFAGFYFTRRLVAIAVPLTAMVISNLALDWYGSWLMVVTVYSSFLLAPLLARSLKNLPANWLAAASKTVLCVLLPSCFFFLTTNAAQWLVDGQHLNSMYPRDLGGLMLCYTAGIPFFRWMLSGDVAFTAIIFMAYCLATVRITTPQRGKVAPAPIVKR